MKIEKHRIRKKNKPDMLIEYLPETNFLQEFE